MILFLCYTAMVSQYRFRENPYTLVDKNNKLGPSLASKTDSLCA